MAAMTTSVALTDTKTNAPHRDSTRRALLGGLSGGLLAAVAILLLGILGLQIEGVHGGVLFDLWNTPRAVQPPELAPLQILGAALVAAGTIYLLVIRSPFIGRFSRVAFRAGFAITSAALIVWSMVSAGGLHAERDGDEVSARAHGVGSVRRSERGGARCHAALRMARRRGAPRAVAECSHMAGRLGGDQRLAGPGGRRGAGGTASGAAAGGTGWSSTLARSMRIRAPLPVPPRTSWGL